MLLLGLAIPQGYHSTWAKDHDRMTCEKDAAEQMPSWGVPLIAGLSVLGVLLLAAAALLVWFRMAVQLKNKWQRDKELNRHRQLGGA